MEIRFWRENNHDKKEGNNEGNEEMQEGRSKNDKMKD